MTVSILSFNFSAILNGEVIVNSSFQGVGK